LTATAQPTEPPMPSGAPGGCWRKRSVTATVAVHCRLSLVSGPGWHETASRQPSRRDPNSGADVFPVGAACGGRVFIWLFDDAL